MANLDSLSRIRGTFKDWLEKQKKVLILIVHDPRLVLLITWKDFLSTPKKEVADIYIEIAIHWCTGEVDLCKISRKKSMK